MLIGSDYVEGLISKMRNIHKGTPSSFRRRENTAAIVKAPPPGALTKGPDRKFPGLHPPPGGATSASLSTNRRFAFPIFAFLAVLAVGLLFLLPGGLLQAQDSDAIPYPENGTGPVATYTAVDPEMTAIVSWSPGGDDAALFSIEGGVLMFKKSPDYEMPADADMDNVYMVTVQAKDSTGKTGMKMVTVEVTNVEEPGMVSLSALQPQAGTELTATHSDPDGTISDLKWQWAKSMTMDGTYEDIDKAILSTYTPKDADIDYYLQATASYTDPEGEGKTAMGPSANAVQGLRSDNNSPVFPPDEVGGQSDTTTREVAENTPTGSAIGDPVVAEDEDGDILTYTLSGDDADDSFSINWATGQLMTKEPLDFETATSHTVTVRATDPAGVPQIDDAGEDNSDEITVTITVTNVNEPPAVSGEAAVTFNEGTGDITALDEYTADDPENAAVVTWTVAGDDSSKFDVSAGALTFKAKPDYEAPTDANKDNVYEVTVRAADDDGNRGEMAVKVTVENEDEDGTVSLSRTQIRVGVPVTASLSDPDGSISSLTWQWYEAAVTEENAIEDANSDTYTPVADDVGDTLTAVASYTDGHGSGKTREGAESSVVAVDTRNRAPVFEDQDAETDGVQNESTTRKVGENTEAVAADDALANNASEDVADNVGSPVTATDPDPNADPLTYTLGGTDASKFRVRDTGQIEVASGTELDFETKQTYMVTVMAEDSFGDSASIMVTITVTDVNEGPDITGEDTIEHPENRTSSVETYRASDPERAGTITWSLAGTDAALFDISSNGALTFKKSPDYEMAAGEDSNNMYEVIVQATDADRRMGTKMVEVMVTNVDEPGVVTLSARQPMAGVLLTANITDPDGAIRNPEWQWQKGSSNISGANMETYTPADSDRGSHLRATVTYKDPESGRDTKRANVRSDYVVLRAASGNNAPEFADDQDPVMDGDQAAAARKVAENTKAGENIGAPVRATDADSGQKLTYTLDATNADVFDIDWATGQLKTKDALNHEDASCGYSPNADPTICTYEVTVRATDPAGDPQADNAAAANSDTVMVNITITDVNEPPAVTGMDAVTFDEVNEDIETVLHTYTEDNPEDSVGSTWSVAGADGSKFGIDNGALTFKVKPDYEMPTDANTDNVYEVTVRAADADGYIGTKAVKVSVTNEDEDGTVSLSKTQIRVGVPVTASLSDPDGSISSLTWQWYEAAVTEENAIEDANSDTYTPVADDVGDTLTAVASYTDGHGSGKTREGAESSVVAVDTRNRAPVFEDQDAETDGVQNESTTRKVGENTEAVAADDALANNASEDVADNVGSPVTATDPDPNTEALIYTLGGDDADKFRVRSNGQIEVGAGTELDYETKGTYMVTVMAEDSFGDSASIMVTIMVTDMDEPPEIMRAPDANVAPEFASATTSRTVSENMVAGVDIGNPVAASDANGDALTYRLSGTDAASFDIDPATGQLMTLAALDYETKATYSVTVTASDSGGLSDSIDVTVTVTAVGEMMGEVTLWASPTDPLTMAPQVGETITGLVVDPDGGVTGQMWQWSRTMDTVDMNSWMPITGATDAAYTVTEDDADHYLRVMATYTDAVGTDMAMVYSMPTMMVTAEAEDPLLAKYDDDNDGWIQLDEARVAVGDYFSSPKGSELSLADTRKVVGLYFEYKNRPQ